MPKQRDLTGQRFGKLTVVQRAGCIDGRTAWLCKCDCGNETIVRGYSLETGDTKSCGCWRKSFPRSNFRNLAGQKFGMLTAIKKDDGQHPVKWICECDCGNIKSIASWNLVSGNTKSCGCNKARKGTSSKSYIHGFTNKPLYNVWEAMKQRCENPNSNVYKWYGGEGKKICDEWKNFAKFRDWALENGYKKGLTLDRIDGSGDYCPENCRWATRKEQQNNRRNNRVILIDGQSKTMSQWAEEVGIKKGTISERLRNGWTERDAVLVPVGTRKKKGTA